MKILAIEIEHPTATHKQFEPYLKAEAARVWELYQAGVFRELYFRGDAASAVLIMECTDTEEADHILSTMPLVQAGLITFEVIPLRAYPGFKRLFAAKD